MNGFELFADGFIGVGAGFVRIFSLGHYCPNWEMDWCEERIG